MVEFEILLNLMEDASLLHKISTLCPGERCISPSIRERQTSIFPQMGALNQKVLHSQGDQTVITVGLNTPRHEEVIG